MDVKKSSKASLENKRTMYILMGFVAVLSFVYIAFEWTQHEVTIYENESMVIDEEEEIEIIQTAEELPPPPPPAIRAYSTVASSATSNVPDSRKIWTR